MGQMDTGGIRYKIEVINQSPPEIQQFIADIRQARTEFKAFKTELGARSRSSSQMAADLSKLAKATRQATQASIAAARADAQAAQSMGRRAKAVEDFRKAYDKKVKADAQAEYSAQKNYTLERRAASAARQRAEAEAKLTKLLEQRRRSENLLSAARDRNIKLTDEERRKLGLLTAEEKRLYDARKRLQDLQSRGSNSELQKINAETEALRRQTRARQEAITRQILAAKGLDERGNVPEPEERRSLFDQTKAWLGLDKAIGSADNRANRAGFTFRRLFGIFAAFAAVRTVIGFFQLATREAILFNAELERVEIGIAGVLSAVATIRDVDGQAVDAERALAIAGEEARRQVRLLRKDAILTTASFTDLVEAFQTGLAPGLQAGFDVDQVRRFTRQISLAASAIGLEQRQLAEEIRSILTGTIRPQNTRIAVALGLTNEDIRNAREAGNLFEFLEKKFRAFDVAAAKASRSLPGLFERVRDAAQQALGEGAGPLVDQLRDSLGSLLDELVQIDAVSGDPVINPKAVEIIALVLDGVRKAIREFDRLKQAISFDQLRSFARGIGDLIGFVAQIAGAFIEGIVKGVGFIFRVLQGLRTFVQNITGIDILDVDNYREIIVIVTAIAAGVLTIVVAVQALGASLKVARVAIDGIGLGIRGITLAIRGSVAGLRLFRTAMVSIGVASSPLLGTFLALAAAIASIVFAADQLSKNPIFNLSDTKFGTQVARIMNLTPLNAGITLFENGFNVEKTVNQLVGVDRLLKEQVKTAKTFGEAWDEASEDLSNRVKALFEEAQTSINQTVDEGTTGFVLENSQAIEELRARLIELRDAARQSRDSMLAQAEAIGLLSEVGQIATLDAEGRLQAAREEKDLLVEISSVRSRIFKIEEEISNGAFQSAEELRLANGKITALTERLLQLEQARENVAEAVARIKANEIQALAFAAEFQLEQENATLKIEAANARLFRIYEQQNNRRALAVLTAQQELDIATEIEQQENDTALNSIFRLQALKEATDERIASLEALKAADNFSTDDQEALDSAIELSLTLEGMTQQLREQAEANRLIAEEERKRLENNLLLAQIQQDSPIRAGIVEAFASAFDEVSDMFDNMVTIFGQSIRSFGQFISGTIVDAFDPTADTDIVERFARFLQSIASLIIETLVQLAVTAAALNLASGGLLGPLMQRYAVARGFRDGGKVAEGRHEGGRAERKHRRRAVFHRAKGFAEGGKPGAMAVHGVVRPSGLHPADTVPIWADPREWVINAGAVAMAGGDEVLRRFNAKLFDPFLLQAAVGLRPSRARRAAARKASNGFNTGGRASQARIRPSQESGQGSERESMPVAAIPMSKDQADRFFRGNSDTLLKVLAANGILPRR